MALPGKFGISAAGSATYSIPIVVPPGTAGMLPSLALAYSSQGGNGLLGMGWTLDGLPSIGHCPKTLAQDSVRGSVNYDANDRFCMDGQRLIVISGTYGADGSEYRTEIESFSRVIAHGTAGNGPAWFEVKTKSGQVMQFGNSTDSRVLAQGKTTARDWALNRVADTKNNYFTVTYTNDTTNGQAYPTRIDYTANDGASLAAYNSVRFVYASRPDIVPTYQAGSLRQITVRLTNVQTYAGASMVADYRLAYAQGSSTNRSQLTSVTLCDGSGANCLPATTFTWQNGTTNVSVTSNVASQNGTLSGYRSYVGDFNGDGIADVMWDSEYASWPISSGTRVLWTGTGTSFTVTSNFAGRNGQFFGYTPMIADFNRDGRSDVWWYSGGVDGTALATSQWFSTSSGTLTVTAGPTPPLIQAPLAMDINGDGRADMTWPASNTLKMWLTNANGTITTPADVTGCSSFPGWSPCSLSVGGGDFNGDGLTDLLWYQGYSATTPQLAIWLGLGDGTFNTASATSYSSLTGYTPYFADFNGDGKTDILWDKIDSNGRTQGQRQLWLSKGDGTFATSTNVGGQDGTLSGYRAHIGDFNGDGLADILWVQETGGSVAQLGGDGSGGATNGSSSGSSSGARVLWAGKGDGSFTVITNFAGQNGTVVGYAAILGDFNGDGKTDILWDSRSGTDTRSTGTRVLWLSDGAAPDLVTSITTGIGANVAVTYKPLTSSAVYTKDNTAVDPQLDLQGPMFVVSRVDSANGIGGTVSSTYAYVGAKADQSGRGFLGFRQMAVTDLQTNIVSTTTYRQDYPYTFLASSETKKLGTATLNSTTNTYGSTALGGTRYQVFLTQSQASSADLDGSALPTATSTYQYDSYGNATQIVVSASDGFTKTTTNTYANDATNWLLGRLTGATVTSQSP